MKKLLAILLMLTLVPMAATGETDSHTLEKKSVPVYCSGGVDTRPVAERVLLPDYSLYYLDGVNDLPYVDLSEFMTLVNGVDAFDRGDGADAPQQYTGHIDEEKHVFTCTYEPRQSQAIFDFRQGRLTYSCADTFGKGIDHSPFEVQPNHLDFLQQTEKPLASRAGGPKTISLSDYDIPMVVQDGKYLVPLQTAADFLIWEPKSPWKTVCCNGAAVFVGDRDIMFGWASTPSDLGELYLSQQPARRTPQLAQYGLNELCLLLDCFYGLKDAHRIDSFRGFLRNNGYEERFLSADPKEADQALVDLINFALDDFHTAFTFPSWMSGGNEDFTYDGEGISAHIERGLEEALDQAYGQSGLDSDEFYTECGNTAFLTVGMLYTGIDSERYYSMNPEDRSSIRTDDLVERILYADRRINRENSPIENVVIDLSQAPGGDVNSTATLLSWLLGEGYVPIGNSFTGGLGVSRYKADINRDHQFTEADSLIGKKKLFCLISPKTFSSANMAAAMMKMSGRVTLIGRPSRGGSGSMTPATTAWGTLFRISGFRTVATVKNGSWYDADPGVTPDVYLSDFSVFYNRERLAEIINGLH